MGKKIIGYVVASILLVGIVVTLWLLFTGKLLPEYTVSFETNSMAGQTVELDYGEGRVLVDGQALAELYGEVK